MRNSLLRKAILIAGISLTITPVVVAQKFNPGDDFFISHLNTPGYDIDKDATAIVLYEKQTVSIENDYKSTFLKKQTRRIIKILKKHGSSYADVSFSIFLQGDGLESVKDLSACSYHLQDGKLVQQKMNESNVQQIRTKYMLTAKFSIPAVSEGTIIDYTYTITQTPSMQMCFWEFQSDIPKLYSEVEINTPKMFKLVSVGQSEVAFKDFDDKGKDPFHASLPLAFKNSEEFYYYEAKYTKKRWVRKNVAAAYEEPFTYNYKNYTENLELQITGFETILFKGDINLMQDWEKFNKYYFENDDYYRLLKKLNHASEDKIKQLTAGLPDPLEKAKALYKFVRDKVNTTEGYSIEPVKTVNEVLQDGAGSATEKNFLLIAALRSIGLDAEPLMLGTQDKLALNPLVPVLERFDRTICRLNLAGVPFYLDASRPYYPFAILDPECYNGYCRVISATGGEAVSLEPKMVKDKQHVMISTEKTEDDKVLLNIKRYPGLIHAAEIRAEWAKDSTAFYQSLLKQIKEVYTNAKLVRYKMHNASDPDASMMIEYVMEFSFPKDENEIFLSLDFIKYFSENPLKAKERKYPIELPSTMDYGCVIKWQLPAGWKADKLPPPNMVKIDEGNHYKYYPEFDEETNTLNLSSRMILNDTYFEREDYETLQAFFDKIIEVQNSYLSFVRK